MAELNMRQRKTLWHWSFAVLKVGWPGGLVEIGCFGDEKFPFTSPLVSLVTSKYPNLDGALPGLESITDCPWLLA